MVGGVKTGCEAIVLMNGLFGQNNDGFDINGCR